MAEPGDSGLYVYGVTRTAGSARPAEPWQGLVGMDGHPVAVVSGPDGLSAAVTEVALPRPPGRRRDLLSHSDVLNALATTSDVVPLRFGTVFADADEVVDELLVAWSESLTALLDRVSGAVQFNLRASYVEERVLAGVVHGSPEIRRLRERTQALPAGTPHPDVLRMGRLVAAAVGDLRREDSALLAESVLPLVRESVVRERSTPDHVLDLALLVDRRTATDFEEHLEQVAADVHERIRLELTGPLAPFEFVGGEPWA